MLSGSLVLSSEESLANPSSSINADGSTGPDENPEKADGNVVGYATLAGSAGLKIDAVDYVIGLA